jgi:hypothetical protein
MYLVETQSNASEEDVNEEEIEGGMMRVAFKLPAPAALPLKRSTKRRISTDQLDEKTMFSSAVGHERPPSLRGSSRLTSASAPSAASKGADTDRVGALPVVSESELEYNSRGSLILDERCTFLLPAPRSSLSAAASSTASLTEPVAALSEPSDPFLAVFQANRAMHQTAEAAALLIQRLYRAKNARRQAFFTRTGLDEARNELFDSMDQTSLKERASRETSRARHLSPKPISAVRRLSIRAMASLRSQRMASQGVPHQAAETQTATLQDAYRVKKAQHKATDLSDLSV